MGMQGSAESSYEPEWYHRDLESTVHGCPSVECSTGLNIFWLHMMWVPIWLVHEQLYPAAFSVWYIHLKKKKKSVVKLSVFYHRKKRVSKQTAHW